MENIEAEQSKIRLFLRIVEKKYAKDILDGKFRFTSLNSYRKFEEINHDYVVGDSKEGTFTAFYTFEGIKLVNTKTKKTIVSSPKAKAEYNIYENVSGKGVLSLVHLTDDDFSYSDAYGGYIINDDVLNDIKKLFDEKERISGNKCRCIIINPVRLLENIKNSEDEIEWGKVDYYSENQISPNRSCMFGKRKKYAYQREYRFIKKLPENSEVETVTLNGLEKGKDIKSITFKGLSDLIAKPSQIGLDKG